MTKMHTEDWERFFAQCKKNRRKLLNPFFSKKDFVILKYQEVMGQKPGLNDPKTFNEKLNAIKINDRLCNELWRYADKAEVRKYVAEKIGKEYLIPQYLCVEKITENDWDNLPNQFVLKTTNGSGTNYIVRNKDEENKKAVINYINWLTRLKYGYLWGEFHYNKIKPKVVAEKLLLDKKGEIPDDLKCYCFKDDNGVRRKVLYIERVVGDERKRLMFDEDWKVVDYGSSFGELDIKLEKPRNYKEILGVIDKLSGDFNFVRVDLFILGKKIYFGELTFVPTAGYMRLKDKKTARMWGDWIGNWG